MTTYNSNQSRASIQESYYNVMYRHAFKVTGSDKLARKLADRVYKELEHRYANNPISSHIDAYLAAQVYLSYAQKGLGDSDEVIDYEVTFSEPENVSRVANPPEAAPAIQAGQRAEPQAPAEEIPALKTRQVLEQPMPVPASTVAPPEPPRAAPVKAGIPVPTPAAASAPQGPLYYDKKSTVFWTPGAETKLPTYELPAEEPAEEPAKDVFDFEFQKPPLTRHSGFFSFLNVLLTLCCVAAIGFLLMELEIIPKLF